MHHCLYGYILKKIIDNKTQRQPSYFLRNSSFPTRESSSRFISFNRELISVGILFLLPHMVTIFILLLVAEYKIKIAKKNNLREVLGRTDCERQRMKRERKRIL